MNANHLLLCTLLGSSMLGCGGILAKVDKIFDATDSAVKKPAKKLSKTGKAIDRQAKRAVAETTIVPRVTVPTSRSESKAAAVDPKAAASKAEHTKSAENRDEDAEQVGAGPIEAVAEARE